MSQTIAEHKPESDVWISPRGRSKRHVYHIYGDCPMMGEKARPKPPAVLFDDRTLCEHCEKLENQ